MRTRGRRGWLMLLAGTAFVLVLGFFGAWSLYTYGVCGPEERSAFSEFAQYNAANVEPEPNLGVMSCQARYDTRDSREQVVGYFAERLEADGWEYAYGSGLPGRDGLPADGEMVWGRDGLWYQVDYTSLDAPQAAPARRAGAPPGGTGIVVNVHYTGETPADLGLQNGRR